MKKPLLNDLRIIDFTRVLAGPFATRILADFGAEVIKIESKKVRRAAGGYRGNYDSHWNRNKRSVTLDLSRQEARDIVRLLISASDVVMENFSPRVMFNWGLDYEKIKKVRADIIMVSLSGMGQTGPWRDYLAFGSTIQALSGLTYLTAYDKNEPIGVGYSHADLISGLYGALAVLTAVEYRERTGRGQHIDLSEYEALCTTIGPTFLDILANDREVIPDGSPGGADTAAPHGCYPCRGDDRWCVIAVFNEAEWAALCRVIGRPSWADDPKFDSFVKREKHKKELDRSIAAWTAVRPPEQIVKHLQTAGVHAGVVQNAEDLARDPHLRSRAFFITPDPSGDGDSYMERSPIRMHCEGPESWKKAPSLGEDNRYVFKKLLGFTEKQLSDYVQKGVIA